ncbi:hypothetical protein LINPERPRIM_LOCUS9037 [Linum perenne]
MVVLVALMAALVSGQEMAPAPSPSQVTGAGFSVPVSAAVVGVSLVASFVSLLKL